MDPTAMPRSIRSSREFLEYFFEARNLVSPDGRPLYAYKISDVQYNALKTLLKYHWEDGDECYACFVLYAVEYLRIEFESGHITWVNIFSPIGKKESPPRKILESIITTGLIYWKRGIYITSHANEYIESLRFESGIPNACLNIESGVARLITKSFQVLESYQVNEDELVSQIQFFDVVKSMPGVLQQPTFYELVAKICIRLLDLKQRFNLGNETNPIDVLNTKYPAWKEQMPLKVSGEGINRFFDNLISEISKIEKLDRPVVRVVHELLENNGQTSIISRIDVPRGNYSPSALSIDDIDKFNDLPSHYYMVVQNGDLSIPMAHFTKTVDGKIASSGYSIHLPFKVYGRDWRVGFSSNKQSIEVSTEISSEFPLRQDEPLLFTQDGEGRWLFEGSGNLKVRKSSGRILIPDSIQFVGEYRPEKMGETPSGLSIYNVDQTSIFSDDSGTFTFAIVLNHDSDAKYIISLKQVDYGIGSHHWLKQLNKHIWFGTPVIYSINPSFGIRERFNGTISILSSGGWKETKDIQNYFGTHKMKFFAKSNETLGYQSLSILPHDFDVDISEREALVRIRCREAFQIFSERGDVTCTVRQEEGGVAIAFDQKTISEDPYIDFLVVLANNKHRIRIKLPNPAIHEVFVNSEGRITNQAIIALDRFHGNSITIHNFSGRTVSKQYMLRLIDPHSATDSEITITKEIKVNAHTFLRFPLYNWAADINGIFSMSQSVDAFVRISSTKPHHFVDARRFDFGAKIFEGQLSIDGSNPSELRMKAFRLDETFTPSNTTDIAYDEETSKWNLEKSLPCSGVWFVYSAKGSMNKVRPKVFLKGIENQDSVQTATIQRIHETCLMSFDNRLAAFVRYFDSRHNAFDDPVWQELYELYKEMSHLPFNTLDVWKGLIKSEKGILTFLLSNWGDNLLIADLTKEFSFSWQLIPISLWAESLEAWYLKKNQEPFFQDMLSMKMKQIREDLEFRVVTDILSGITCNSNETEYPRILNGLINGDGHSCLRGRHPEGTSKWPNIASDFIKEKFKLLPENARRVIPSQFQQWQKPVIYLPIIFAYQSAKGNFINQSELDERTKLGLMLTADFDREYFQEAFYSSQNFFYSN